MSEQWWVMLDPNDIVVGQVLSDVAPTAKREGITFKRALAISRRMDMRADLLNLSTGEVSVNAAWSKACVEEELRADATRQILEFAPWHVQFNDMNEPLREGAAARRAKINAIRAATNVKIAALKGA